MAPQGPIPRQLGAILDVLGLDWSSLFAPAADAGENRNKVVGWLYRILDTLDSKTSHLLSFPALLLTAQTFLAGLLVRDRLAPRSIAISVLVLLIVPLATAVFGLIVFNVKWPFFGRVRAVDQDTFDEDHIKRELRELAEVCDQRFRAHKWSGHLCRASALAFLLTLLLALVVVASGSPKPAS